MIDFCGGGGVDGGSSGDKSGGFNGNGSNGHRFVCPNDRQLSLRAKLKTGWSMKSFSAQGSSQPLDPDEHETIVKVIKRAEKIDLTEQERVGRLVDRLDMMRKNALGRNATQCLLCGFTFGILLAKKTICMDCHKLICSKCSIQVHNKNHLCLICVETREIWKKSGAWFFKTLPKYILPEEKNSLLKLKLTKIGVDDDDSSSDEDKFWTKKRNSATESMHDVADQISLPISQISSFNETPPTTIESVSEIDIENDSILNISRSRSEFNWSIEKISPSTSSVMSTNLKTISPNDSPMGYIELSLNYDPITLTLHCTVYRAKNLVPMDINGLADPFCKLNILPNPKSSTRLRTKTIHKTRNPEFNENLTFYDISDNDLKEKALHIIIVDDDIYGHDFMGETKINLAKLKVQNTIYITVPLEKFRNDPKIMEQWFDDLWLRGQILLSLCYSTKKRCLLVTVCRCTNLLPMDNNGYSDPFVKLQLKPDPYHRKHKTSIKWKNLNPIYNEEFAFETRPTELATQSLYVTVYDKDYGKSNDYLGGLVLGGSGSKGHRLKHWLDMIRYPDHRHEAWHNLIENELN